jgi:branched-chain amino acid transport system permease protein
LERFIFLTFDGVSRGAIYAAFALALVLIWRAARVVNFAQGAMAVVTAYAAYMISDAVGSYLVGFIVALVFGLLLGAVVEKGLMRFVGHANPLNDVIVAIGLVLFLTAIIGMIFGGEYRAANHPFGTAAIGAGGGIPLMTQYDLFIWGTVATMVVLLALLFTRTAVGLRMRAAAFAPEVSRLLGVNVGGMLTLGWALAAAVGAIAGVLIVPTELGLHPHAMDIAFASSFAAAVVGGLDSPVGAVVGGVIVGLILSYVSGYIGPSVTPIAVLVVLLAVLLVRPGGIFSSVRARAV